MIRYNNKQVELNHFPDGTLLIKELVAEAESATITWLFENNEELVALYFLTNHLRTKGVKSIELEMPYIPNARQDRVKAPEDVFTLKYFAQLLNSMGFSKVIVWDPHSYVSEALIDRVEIRTPKATVEKVMTKIREDAGAENVLLFYPDEGAMKRYSAMFDQPYVFGIKKRDWTTGEIRGLDVTGRTDLIANSTILIVDDICSRGGTFYYSAKTLKELGAKTVYLYVTHCENTIMEGDILTTNLVDKVYTTKSIFTKEHKKVEVV